MSDTDKATHPRPADPGAREPGIEGYWYDGQSSRRWSAALQMSPEGSLTVVDAHHGAVLATGAVTVQGKQAADWQISPRLAHTSRYLYHRNGGSFETLDNTAIDRIQQQFQPSILTGLVHRLETHKRFIGLTVVLVLAFAWGTVTWGVPTAARVLADRVPAAAVHQLSRETLAIADRAWFAESQLEPEIITRLDDHFAAIIADHPELNLRVLWRGGGRLGANAVALPDGTMVFTDELVALSQHDDELAAILLHEIGHIEHQHGLRLLIQSSLLGLGFVLLTGDVSGTAEVLLSAPLIINELSYSRRFEFEADAYAREYMLANDMDLQHFRAILWRLTHGGSYNPENPAVVDKSEPWARYLSTHPPTAERLERF